MTNPKTPVVEAASPDIEPDCDNDGASEEDDAFDVDDHRLVATYMVVPPDGGWGWVIVVAAFFCNMVVDGIIFSYGMLMSDIMVAFDETKPKAALVGSLLSGFYLLVGPLCSALANRYGFRVVAILGSVIGCIGFVLSFWATSITFLCITYGIIGGVGFGMVYVPAVITVGFYFEKWRALATGIAVCGSGIGTCVLAPLMIEFIDMYGWRGTILIQAGLILNCAVFGSMFRPLEPVEIMMNSRDIPDAEKEEQLSLLQKIKEARDFQLEMESNGSLVDTGAIMERTGSRSFLGANNNAYPTAAQVFAGSNGTLTDRRKSSYSLTYGTASNLTGIPKSQKRMSAPPDSLQQDVRGMAQEISSQKAIFPLSEVLNPVQEERRDSITAQRANPRRSRGNLRTGSVVSLKSGERSRRNSNVGVRPFYRDDIYFGASLQRLPQYTSQTSVKYHMSVSRLPSRRDVKEEETSACVLCPEAVKRTLATMLDMSLLQSPSFILLTVSGCITMMGFYVPFMFLVERAAATGVEPWVVKILIAGIGVSNTIGRVVCGLVSSMPGVNALVINNIALTLGGIATIVSGLSTSTAFQITYITVFGLAIACFASLRSIIIVDLLGLDKLTNAFGLLLLFQGIAAMIGAPLAGWFQEVTNSYDAAFWFSGSLIFVSALLTYPLNWVNRREKAKIKAMERANV